MATWTIRKYGEMQGGPVQVTSSEPMIRFMFNGFVSKRPGHYAELINPAGDVVATIPNDHPPTTR